MYPIHYLETTPSTNRLAKELAESGAVHGTAVIAASQTEGRGRLGKSWFSAPGKGLYCSIIVRTQLPVEDYPKITLAAGLGVALAIDDLAGVCSQLKWPNDIFIDSKKCGGILTESSSLNNPAERRYAIIGIGINLGLGALEFPADIRNHTTSLYIETGKKYGAREVFPVVRDEVLKQLDDFYHDGFAPILSSWKEKDFLLGKKMECVSAEGKIIVGVSLGPDADGQLHVQAPDGTVHTVLSGDIRLAKDGLGR